MNKSLELSAWLAYWNAEGQASFKRNARHLQRVYPVWYNCKDKGGAGRRSEASEALRHETLAIARDNNVEVWALVSNFNEEKRIWDSERIHAIVRDKATGLAHIHALIEMAKKDGAQGLDLDYESLGPEQRQNLSEFTALAYVECQKAGLKLAMPVHAKDTEPGLASGSAAQDYAELAKHLDLLQLMVYDYHWSTSSAGAITPCAWAGAVARHAASLAVSEKIEFGFPAYGYDWKGQEAESVPWKAWADLVKQHGPARRDLESGELVLNYEGREAWYCDSLTSLRNLDEARRAGLWKCSFWVLGSEDPRFWDSLDQFPQPFAMETK